MKRANMKRANMKRNKLKTLARNILSEYSTFLVLAVLIIYGIIGVRHFVSRTNISAILYQYSIIGLLAVGQLVVILTGGIDLSQGALIALTSITTASVMQHFGLLPGLIAGLASGTAIGLINGFLISRTPMPPFLVTLGTMGVARGVAMQIANARPVPIIHDGFMDFGYVTVAGIPISAFIWAAVCFAVAYLLNRRSFGRHIYAVGSSEENTRLSGVKVQKIKLLVYTLSAALASAAGILWTSRLGSGSPVGGSNYELESIATVVVGGASLMGGVGRVSGVVAGVLIFGIINSILNLSGISPFWQGMLKGMIILIAIAIRKVEKTEAL